MKTFEIQMWIPVEATRNREAHLTGVITKYTPRQGFGASGLSRRLAGEWGGEEGIGNHMVWTV